MTKGTFKEQYEALNGKSNPFRGRIYRPISLVSDDLFVQKSGTEIVKMMDDKESFYLYIGDEKCPWCRSVLEMAEKVALRNDIRRIFYIKIWNDEHREIFRDQYVLEDGKLIKTEEGDPSYNTLLDKLGIFLKQYTLFDQDGKEIDAGEKRVFIPGFFFIEDGIPVRFTTGVSEIQAGPLEEFNPIILADEEDRFMTLFGEI